MILCRYENGRCIACGHTTAIHGLRRHCGGIHAALHQPRKPPPAPTHGPGTELKKLLSKVGITASPDCSCNARARMMDESEAKSPGWCEEHLDEIVGWLREEAWKRGLPFVDMAGRVLVRRAIANARREHARAGRPRLHARG